VILADHCVYAATIRALEAAGYRVFRLQDLDSPDLPDTAVLELATKRDLILLTNDTGFGNVLRYPPWRHGGIVVLKFRPERERDVSRLSPRGQGRNIRLGEELPQANSYTGVSSTPDGRRACHSVCCNRSTTSGENVVSPQRSHTSAGTCSTMTNLSFIARL
jgi:hypothetical protein